MEPKLNLFAIVLISVVRIEVRQAAMVLPPQTQTRSSASLLSDIKQKTNAFVDTLVPSLIASMVQYKASIIQLQAQDVCYGELGCFSRVGNCSTFARLPESPAEVGTVFDLFTSWDQITPEKLDYTNPASITATKFRPQKTTFVVIHGFGEDAETPWIAAYQVALLQKVPEANFIAVDWVNGAAQPDYWQAAVNTQLVGAQIAKLLAVIWQQTKTPTSLVHLIGFSLGAQVAGLTSNKLVEFGLPRVGRITGLDAAGPIFEDADPYARLDENDADFVQAVHGNGASLAQGAFGIIRRVGHQDFYPNGGQFQPGCPQGLASSILESILHPSSATTTVVCNHLRAVEYVLESIGSTPSTCHFASHPCASYSQFTNEDITCLSASEVPLNIFSPKLVSSNPLYLVTTSEPTYCTNGLKVTVRTSSGIPTGRGSITFGLPKSKILPSYTVLKDTKFTSSGTFQEVFFSRLSIDDFQGATIQYTRICSIGLLCGPSDLNVASVTIQDLAGERSTAWLSLKLQGQ